MGPIAVAGHLAPYLPKHPFADVGGETGIGAISSTPWGSPSILLISYAYIKMLGGNGMTAIGPIPGKRRYVRHESCDCQM